ncbi:MAG: Outer membrane adhesin like protein [Candidatus Magasanikbacteria bacterium GW2011_GWC2_37_14]|uniref:Outer membrane adhesin like protein proteiin n=1 Tax=Candidatus Magasanikbacteria bacterium GW2011_GWC2_37_14 TaxID=1619046 RepID=A0A0G0JIR2_9BACT|nr:MAG: Outer membrane adhesin like protein [Candidatus Magasanikbacteria bacterium GW2011_GWC2_37_14]
MSSSQKIFLGYFQKITLVFVFVLIGVLFPQVFGLKISESKAVTFSSSALISEDSPGVKDMVKLKKINGIYYLINKPSGSGPLKMATSSDGINWSSFSNIANGINSDYDFGYYANGGYFYAVFSNFNYTDGASSEIVITTSSDAITWSATSTAVSVIGDGGPIYLSVLSSSNYLTLAYTRDFPLSKNYEFLLATSTNGISWSTSTIATELELMVEGFVADSDGSMHALYSYISDENYNTSTEVYLEYAKSTDGGVTWSTSTFGRTDYQFYSSDRTAAIAIDSNGNPGVVYYTIDEIDEPNSCTWDVEGEEWTGDCNVTTSIRYAKYSGSAWASSTVVTFPLLIADTSYGLGIKPSLTFAENNEALFVGAGSNFYPYLITNTNTLDINQFTITQIDSKAMDGYSPWDSGVSMIFNTNTLGVDIAFIGDDGSSTDRDVFYTTSTAVVAPVSPTGLTATPSTTTQIDLTWNSTGGATSYILYGSEDNFSTTSTVTTTASTSYSDTGLTASITYYYKIAAINEIGTGVASASVNTTTLADAPAYDGNLPLVSNDAKTKLLWVNDVYYYAFSSSTGSDYNVYLTTSTNGGTGTWSEPQLIFASVKPTVGGSQSDNGLFAFEYNSFGNYFGVAAFASSTFGAGGTYEVWFSSSTNGSSWSATSTVASGLPSSDAERQIYMDFSSQEEFVGVFVKSTFGTNYKVYYSTSTGSSWDNSGALTFETDTYPVSLGFGISGTGVSRQFHTAYYGTSGNFDIIYASSTDNVGTSWTTTTVASNVSISLPGIGDVRFSYLNSFTLDDNGLPGLIYYDITTSTPDYHTTSSLIYAKRDGNSVWTSETIADDISITLVSHYYFEPANLTFYDTDKPIIFTSESNLYPMAIVNTSSQWSSLFEGGSAMGDFTELSSAYNTTSEFWAGSYVTADGQLYFVTSSLTSLVVIPDTPTGLTATPVSSVQIDLTWNSSAGATSYVLYSATTSGFVVTTTVTTTALTSFSNTGLTASAQYYYKVAAANAIGTSISSMAVNTTTLAGAPAYGGNLPVLPANSIQKLVYANSLYYLAFTSSTGGLWDIYITTSTNGVSGTWSEPILISPEIVKIDDNGPQFFDFIFNTTANNLGLVYIASTTGITYFTTSTNAISWSTGVNTMSPVGGYFNFDYKGDNVLVVSKNNTLNVHSSQSSYSTDGGSSWVTSAVFSRDVSGAGDPSGAILGAQIGGDGSVHMLYFSSGDGGATPHQLIYASSTDNGVSWVDTTVGTEIGNDGLGLEWGTLSLDSNDDPGVLYAEANDFDGSNITTTIRLAKRSTLGVWATSTIYYPASATGVSGFPKYPKLEFIGSDYPLAFHFGNNYNPVWSVSTTTDPYVYTNNTLNEDVVGNNTSLGLVYTTSTEIVGMSYIDNAGQLYFATSSLTLPAGIPATPTGLTATPISATQIDVAWDSSVGATSYNLYASSDNFVADNNLVTTTVLTSYSHTGIPANFTVYYKISAVNAYGESASSTAVSTTTLSDIIAFDGNLPAVPGNLSNTKLLYVDNLYYLFFTSTTVTSSFDLYLTTSTNGVAGTWSEPQIIFSEMPVFEMDQAIATFGAEYNSTAGYLAFSAISSSTGHIIVATSTNGVTWGQVDTGLVGTYGNIINGMSFASGTNFGVVAYDFTSYLYSTDNWQTINTSTIPVNYDDGGFVSGINAYYPGSGSVIVQAVYGTTATTTDYIFVTTTNHVDFGTTTLVTGLDGGIWNNSFAVDSSGNAGFVYVTSTVAKFLYHNTDGSWSTSNLGVGHQVGKFDLQFFNGAPFAVYAGAYDLAVFAYSTSSPYVFTEITDIGAGKTVGSNTKMSTVYDDATNIVTAVFATASNTLMFVTTSLDLAVSSGSAPIAPSGLGTVVATSSITISWADNSSDEDGFVIQQSLNGVEYSTIATVSANITSTVISSLYPNTRYWEKVASYNTSGTSTYTASNDDYTNPVAPGTPTISNVSTSTLTATWSDNSNGSGTVYYVNYTGGFVTTSATTTNITGLTPNTEYTFAVRTQYLSSSTLYTSYSASSTPTTTLSAGSVPNAPTDIVVTNITTSTMDILWTDNSSDEDGFTLDYSIDGVSSWISGTTTEYTVVVDSLLLNTQYWFRVAAYNSFGTSTFVTSTGDYTNPVTPGTPTISNVSTSSVTATWSDSSNYAGTVYYVNYAGGFVTTSATTTNIIGLTPNTEYTFAVRAQYLSSSTLYTEYSASSTPPTTTLNVVAPEASFDLTIGQYDNLFAAASGTSWTFDVTFDSALDEGDVIQFIWPWMENSDNFNLDNTSVSATDVTLYRHYDPFGGGQDEGVERYHDEGTNEEKFYGYLNSSLSAGSSISITFADVINPYPFSGNGGSGFSNLPIYVKAGTPEEMMPGGSLTVEKFSTSTAISLVKGGGVIVSDYNSGISASSYATSTEASYTFAFTATSSIPNGGNIVVVMPTGFDISGAYLSGDQNINGAGATVSSTAITTSTYHDMQRIFLAISNTSTSPGDTITVTIDGLINPSSKGVYRGLYVYTAEGNDGLIDGSIGGFDPSEYDGPPPVDTIHIGGDNDISVTVYKDNGGVITLLSEEEAALLKIGMDCPDRKFYVGSRYLNASATASFQNLLDCNYAVWVEPINEDQETMASFMMSYLPPARKMIQATDGASVSSTLTFGLPDAVLTLSLSNLPANYDSWISAYAYSDKYMGFSPVFTDTSYTTPGTNGSGVGYVRINVKQGENWKVGIEGESVSYSGNNYWPPTFSSAYIGSSTVALGDFPYILADKTLTVSLLDSGNDNPVTDACVSVTQSNSGGFFGKSQGNICQPNSGNNYVFKVPQGSVVVNVERFGSKMQQYPVSVGALGATKEIYMEAPDNYIAVTVEDSDGNPVNGAGVFAYGQGGHAEGMTGTAGTTTLYLNSGIYSVEAFVPGFGQLTRQTNITVSEEINPAVTFTLNSGSFEQISGRIYYDLNSNDQYDDGIDTPVSQMKMGAGSDDGTNNGGGAETADDGTYTIYVPSTGNYNVSGWSKNTGGLESQPVVVGDSGVSDVDWALGESGTLEITLQNASTISKLFAGVFNPTTQRGSHTGSWLIDGTSKKASITLPAGSYRLDIGSPAYGPIVEGQNVTVTGGVTTQLTYNAAASATWVTISGTVTSDGSPVSGVNVWAARLAGPGHYSDQTDSSGNYSLTVPGNRAYFAGVEYSGYIADEGEVSISVTTENVDQDFTLASAPYTISGKLINLSATALTEGWVSAKKTIGDREVWKGSPVDGAGNYSISVNAGDWTLYGEAPCYYRSSGTSSVVVGSNATTNIALTARAGCSVDNGKIFTVIDTTGGQIVTDDAVINIPANALGRTGNAVNIRISRSNLAVGSSNATPIVPITITATDSSGSSITTLNSAVEIKYNYDVTKLPVGFDESDLSFGYFSDSTGQWESVAGVVDTTNNTVTVEVEHFTDFGPLLPGVPSAPENLVATAASTSQIDLTWNTAANADSYIIYATTTNSGGTFYAGDQIATGVTETSYSHTTLDAETTWYYEVAGYNENGEGANSDVDSATTEAGIDGITVSQTTRTVAEDSGTATYTVVLDSVPGASVVITASESSADFSVSPSTLTFTVGNWNTPQTVTITATSDTDVEGSETADIVHTAVSVVEDYNGISISNVTVTVTDNDSNGSSGSSSSDTTPPTNTSIKINENAVTAQSNQVILTLVANEATQMILSNTSDFAGATWEAYVSSKIWLLTTGAGTKTVYVKFRDSSFNVSSVVSDSIDYLSATVVEIPAPVVVVTPPTTCALTTKSAYKLATSPAVYYITPECTKRAFNKSNVFFTYFTSWNDVQITTKEKLDSIPNDTLGFMPWGPKYDPKYGALVKIVTDPKVYLLLGTEKYWITSEAVFNTLKYSWNWIEDIDPDLLNKYTTGSEITNTTVHPNYTLIKYANNSKVYRLDPGSAEATPGKPELYGKQVKRWIPNETIFNSLNFRLDRIVTIPDTEVYEMGENLK